MTDDNFVDAKELTLDEWLALVYKPPKDKLFLSRAFPSDKHRDEYIATIQTRSHEDVFRLLRAFLMKSESIDVWDEFNYNSLAEAYKSDRERFRKMLSHTYFQRLVNYFKVSKEIYPWEGNTWILDLLPHSPKIALEGLSAYTIAHFPIAPDTILQGLFDAEEVIRAKYIGLPKTQSDKVATLLDLSSRQFEHLKERLYHSMGYETWLTQPSRDGGRDIVARINDGARHEFLLIECKRYTDNVDVGIVRELYGVVSSEKANRGVLITSGKFTPDAKNYADDNSMQLIDGDEFVLLLNEYLGANWFQKLGRILAESEQHYQEARKSAKPKKTKRK